MALLNIVYYLIYKVYFNKSIFQYLVSRSYSV